MSQGATRRKSLGTTGLEGCSLGGGAGVDSLGGGCQGVDSLGETYLSSIIANPHMKNPNTANPSHTTVEHRKT